MSSYKAHLSELGLDFFFTMMKAFLIGVFRPFSVDVIIDMARFEFYHLAICFYLPNLVFVPFVQNK